MKILGIETSCDETSAAIIEGTGNTLNILSNIISSSLRIHGKTGGIIPENAAREQIKFITPVIEKALGTAGTRLEDIDAVALTYGPGLIGSLLVGVETAKTISYVFTKPLIPVNHMIGHIYANWINNTQIRFPAIALVVSGGHTDLLLIKNHGDNKLLGGTRDDAAGEAFDKIGRLLGLPYPGGPAIEEVAPKGNPNRFRFPRPLIGSPDLDFSFSGLKTAVLREIESIITLNEQTVNDLAYATQEAIIDVLIKKTLKAVDKYKARSVVISGGVSANQKLREKLIVNCEQLNVKFFAPDKKLCTDNAAMIASAAYFNFKPESWQNVTADPELYFE